MGVLPFGAKLELPIGLLYPAKPPEKQEKVSFSDTVLEKVGTCLVRLPERWYPARLSDEVATDKVRVQMTEIGSFYPGLPLPMVEAQLFDH